MAAKHKSNAQVAQEGMGMLASMTGSGPVGRAPTGAGENWVENDILDDPVFDVPQGDPEAGEKRRHAEPPDPMRAVRERGGGGEEDFVPMAAHKKRISRMGRKNQALESENKELREQYAELKVKQSHDDRVASITERMEALGEESSPEDREAALLDVVDDLVSRRVEQALGDVDRRFQNVEAFRGLSEEQMAAVEDAREAYTGIKDPEKLLRLAQVDDPDVFRGAHGHGGGAYVGSPGRGSEHEQRADDPVSAADIERSMIEHPESAMELGPYLIKAEMDERYPGVHGQVNSPTRRGQIR